MDLVRTVHLTSFAALLGVALAGCSSAEGPTTLEPTGDLGDARDVTDGAIDVLVIADIPAPYDVRPADAASPTFDVGHDSGGAADAGGLACSVSGAPGQCILVVACAGLIDHTAFAGHCAGPADVECCIVTPNTSDNPPIPVGYHLMTQSQVTPAMTAWAVAILHDPTTYPMFATATMTFGARTVLARVEWHPPDFQNSVVHRGVTLYTPG